MPTLSTLDIFGVMERHSRIPDFEYSNGYLKCVAELHRQPKDDVFERSAEWTRSNDPAFRKMGAEVLGQLGDDRPFRDSSKPILEGMLDDPDPGVVAQALYALGWLNTGDVELIACHAGHSEMRVRRAVANALGSRDEKLAREALIVLSHDDEPEVRDRATFGLGTLSELDTPDIREALFARLEDEVVEVRAEGLVGLARRKDMRAIDAIHRELAREDVDICAFEAAALMPHRDFITKIEDHISINANLSYADDALHACRALE